MYVAGVRGIFLEGFGTLSEGVQLRKHLNMIARGLWSLPLLRSPLTHQVYHLLALLQHLEQHLGIRLRGTHRSFAR